MLSRLVQNRLNGQRKEGHTRHQDGVENYGRWGEMGLGRCRSDRCPTASGIPGTFSFSSSGSIRLFFQREGFLWEERQGPGEKRSLKARSVT
jgi:hypothetical protein